MSMPPTTAGPKFSKVGRILIRLTAVAVLMLATIAFVLNCWPLAFARSFPSALNSPVRHLLLPKAAIALAWDRYEGRRFEAVLPLAAYFNAWQPTVETLLFEGRCHQEVGQTEAADALYSLASRFDPHSRSARLAAIELDLAGMEAGLDPTPGQVDAILQKVPWDDRDSIEKISVRLLALAEKRTGVDRLLLVAPVLYLAPSEPILRRAGAVLLMDASAPPAARRIGTHLVAATLIADRGRLSEGDLLRLDALLLGWAGVEEKVAMAEGRIRWVSYSEMQRAGPGMFPLERIKPGESLPLCKDPEWRRHLGGVLRALHEHF